MATIAVNLNVQVSGGPQISIPPQKVEVEVYEKFEFSIGKDPKTKQDIPAPQAFNLGEGVSFLLIKSSLDEPPNLDKPKLTYKFGAKEVLLDKPHLYVGPGSVSVLGENLTMTLAFTPAEPPKDFVTIEILVGRDIA